MREQDVRILNYLDDWLILAQSREQLCEHRDLVLSHPVGPSGQLGKEQTRPSAEDLFSWYGVGFSQTVSMPHRGTCSGGLELPEYIQGQDSGPTEIFQRLLGHMAAAAAVTPLGLLHMRPLQHWLHGRVPRWAWQSGTYRVAITPECRQAFSPWSDTLFLRAGVPLEQVSRHAVVFTDASATGWGVTYNGHAVSGCGRAPTALAHQLPRVASSTPCPEPPERAVTGRACAGPYGQHCDRCVHQPSRGSALPSHVATRPPSPPLESEASEVASRHSCPWCM